MLTYSLFKMQSMLLSANARKDFQVLTYILFKTQKMLLSNTSKEHLLDADLHPI